jgi:hypothetical protein
MKKIILTLTLFIISPFAFAADYACVQYQREDYSWGDSYKVPYNIVEGSDLQQATNDYSRYKSYTKYAIVEWPNGGYSAMELQSYQDDIPDYSYTNTKDQNGRTYRIKKAPSYGQCPSY